MSDPSNTSPAATTTSEGSGAGAAASAPFYEAFTDEGLKTSPSIQRYKTVEELAKGFVNQEKMLGVPVERRIDLPADMNDAEAMRAVWQKLGAPEKAEGYGVTLPEGADEAAKARLGRFTEQAAKMGLPTPMAKGMLEWWLAEQAEDNEAAEAAMAERRSTGEADLRKEFGSAYDTKVAEVVRLAEKHGVPELAAALKENASANPNLVKMLAKIADAMAEPGDAGARSGDAASRFAERELSPAQAKAAQRTFQADSAKMKALHDKSHPGHKAAVDEWKQLARWADPPPQAA